MRLLELFSGTGSVRNAVGQRFDDIVSLDILQKFNPTECCDILQWDYTKYPSGYFDVIWASPPCTEYSHVLYAKRNRIRDISGANAIVLKTIEIIEYFQPKKWFIENPQTGFLKHQEFMQGIPYVDVDYCKYGFQYRKRTRIWTNVTYSGKLCDKQCGSYVNGHHKISTGNSRFKDGMAKVPPCHQRYAIPAPLIQDLFNSEP